MLNVIRPGTKVSLPQAEIVNAVVLQVNISAKDKVQYQVAWWNSHDRKEAWVDELEVSAEVPDFVPVGFVVPKRSIGE